MTPTDRRHDLDNLRAIAMLLGIVLHASLSFIPFGWPVTDTQQFLPLGLILYFVHGFRMPLFFVVSGFFTAMLRHRRGATALLHQRTQRVLIPCLIGLGTVAPLCAWISEIGGARSASPPVIHTFSPGQDPEFRDKEQGLTLLMWAAAQGDLAMAQELVAKGAKIDAVTKQNSSALHFAATQGQDKLCRFLLDQGANPRIINNRGQTPANAAGAILIARYAQREILRLPLRDKSELLKGSELCQKMLPPVTLVGFPKSDSLRDRYHAFLSNGSLAWLFTVPIFWHLWFLWYLCALVGLYLLGTRFAGGRKTLPFPALRSWVLSPRRFLWLIPLTMIPQYFMGITPLPIGADYLSGWLILPHLLGYYGIFFFFGALYYEADDQEGSLGRHWPFALAIAIVIGLPAILALNGKGWLSDLIQIGYTWLMITGVIGLFRRWFTKEHPVLRYLSDASYWMYLTHLPLVIYLQFLVAPFSLPAIMKFLFVSAATFAGTLLTYHWGVRQTPIGALLNGTKRSGVKASEPKRPVLPGPA